MGDRRDHVLAPDDQALKRASKALVRAAGGTDAAAEQLSQAEHRRCDHRRMSDAGNVHHATFLRIDEVAELEQVTQGLPGAPHITRLLAARTGHGLVKLPEVRTVTVGSDSGCGLLASCLAKEAGEMTGGLLADLADDNEISPAEAAARLTCAGELVRVAVELQHALQLRAAEDR